jgi:hypothetical protein
LYTLHLHKVFYTCDEETKCFAEHPQAMI